MDKRLIIAVFVITFLNVPLLASPFFENNWDSETHLFFADHYRRGWFDPWEEKWYGGFWVYSYPPLAHQLITIFSLPFELEVGYRLVQGFALLAFPLAMWLLAKEVVGVKYAGWAALLSTGVAGVYVVLYTFGQLPAFLALVLTLVAGTFLARYLHSGRLLSLLGWLSFVGATAATNHQTAFVLMPMLASALVIRHWIVKPFGVSRSLLRPIIAAVLFALALAVTIAPFWWWFFTQRLPQVEIPHPTRENIFRSYCESRMFFWDMYGGILILLPIGLWVVIRHRGLWPLGILIVLLGILGLGGLTIVPEVVFQEWWKVFTYERFPLWAVVISLIPIGVWVGDSWERQHTRKYLAPLLLLLLAIGVVGAIAFPLNRDDLLSKPLKRWEETEILKFLEVDGHSQWNYITFGLGEAQLARLSRLTSAQTIDGFFHQARWKEEQRKSGTGTIDSSPWAGEQSYNLLFPILQRPRDWNLRWAIVAHPWTEKHLRNSGWSPLCPTGGWSLLHPIGSDDAFKAGDPVYSPVTVWEAPNGATIPKVKPGQQVGPPYYPQSGPVKQFFKQFLPYLWGLAPLAFLVAGLGVIYWSEIRKGNQQLNK